jgi:hypothetical protein
MAIFDLRDLIVSLEPEICNGTRPLPICNPSKPLCDPSLPGPFCNASLPAPLCNASKPLAHTNIFMCNGSKVISCLAYADEDDLAVLRGQLVDTLFLVQQREEELREKGGDGPVVPATPTELTILEHRLLEAVEKIRSQKQLET